MLGSVAGRGRAWDMDNWDDVKFVLALSRHGTMTAAALALGTNVATVSRRIDRITEQSGTPLFVKKDGAWEATGTALGYVRAAEEFDARIRSERNNAHDAAGRNDEPIRVSAVPFVHHHVLIPALPHLMRQRPFARTVFRNRFESVGLGDTDIVLRFGRPEKGRLMARKVADMQFHAFRSTGRQPPSGSWVGLRDEYDDRPTAILGQQVFGTQPTVRCDTYEHVLAVMQATGLPGVLPDVIGRAVGGFALCDRGIPGVERDVWLAFHQSRRADVAVRATADWIVTAFADTAWANVQDEVEIAAE